MGAFACPPSPPPLGPLRSRRQGIEKTGLGTRIAELLVRSFGGSTRSLALSLAVGELLMTPGALLAGGRHMLARAC